MPATRPLLARSHRALLSGCAILLLGGLLPSALPTALLAQARAAEPAGQAAPLAENPQVEARLIAISEEMRCLVCQNESLAGSRAELAQDLRRELRRLIEAGKSDAEIREFMVSRYGEFVLYRPPLRPATWLLWVAPFLLPLLGLAALLLHLRQRRRAAAPEPMSEAQRQQAQRLLNPDVTTGAEPPRGT